VAQTQLEVSPETTLESLRLARAAGVLTILNTAPAVPDLDTVRRSTYCSHAYTRMTLRREEIIDADTLPPI
jgi:sugar/nucleoside kinase (ribokinase family)